MDLEALRPARSRHAQVPATPWFSVEAARHEVALFDDTSQDDLLTDYINFAVERVSAHVGSQLPGVEITDFWAPRRNGAAYGVDYDHYLPPSRGRRFELSQATVIAGTTIVLGAHLDDDPDTLATVDAADYTVDRTASPPHLVFAMLPSFATPGGGAASGDVHPGRDLGRLPDGARAGDAGHPVHRVDDVRAPGRDAAYRMGAGPRVAPRPGQAGPELMNRLDRVVQVMAAEPVHRRGSESCLGERRRMDGPGDAMKEWHQRKATR